MLANITNKDTNLLLLSFHVDYWNRLGWVDTFSKKAFTKRQYLYGDIFNLQSIYTPQVVINGLYETVGSNRDRINNILNKEFVYKDIINQPLVMFLNNLIVVSIKPNQNVDNYIITALLVEKSDATKINAGENEGTYLKHKNIVREINQFNLSNLKPVTFNIPSNLYNYKIVLLAQKKNNLAVNDVVILNLK